MSKNGDGDGGGKGGNSSSSSSSSKRRMMILLLSIVVVVAALINIVRTKSTILKNKTNNDGDLSIRKTITATTDLSLPSSIWNDIQSQGKQSIQKMIQDGDFNTSISYHDMVLQKGYPLQFWNKCTIHNILKRKYDDNDEMQRRSREESLLSEREWNANVNNKNMNVQLLLLGGSASARSGDNCYFDKASRAAAAEDADCNNTTITTTTTKEEEEEDMYQGRFSNILERELNENMSRKNNNNNNNCHDQNNNKTSSIITPTLNFEVINMGQGRMESILNALMIDQLINLDTVDIIIHEFMINDYNAKRLDKIQKLRFWLTRIKTLFVQHHRRRRNNNDNDDRKHVLPPIVFVFLWPVAAGRGRPTSWYEEDNLNAHPLRYYGPVLKEFQRDNPNWEFQIINVGAAIHTDWIKTRNYILFDDGHHPSCLGCTLIADMIQYPIYNDIAKCNIDDTEHNYNEHDHGQTTQLSSGLSSQPILSTISSSNNTNNTESSLQSSSDDKSQLTELEKLLGTKHANYSRLWTDLFREDAIIGSITSYVPTAGDYNTNLHITNLKEIRQWRTVDTGKSDPHRQDRKYNYFIPDCNSITNTTSANEQQQPFIIQMQEPYLVWLGIGQSGLDNMSIKINEVPINLPDNAAAGTPYIRKWVYIPDLFPSTAAKPTSYNVSMCDAGGIPTRPSLLAFVVGVMIPPKQHDEEIEEKT